MKKTHYIQFTTSDWGMDEYCFATSPIDDYKDAAMDHHIQLRIIEYMKQNNIKGEDKRYKYIDENKKIIVYNDKPLEHGAYKYNNETNNTNGKY